MAEECPSVSPLLLGSDRNLTYSFLVFLMADSLVTPGVDGAQLFPATCLSQYLTLLQTPLTSPVHFSSFAIGKKNQM